MTTMSFKVEDNDKTLFESICKSIGLNQSAAINAFIKATIRENGLPFELKIKEDPYIYDEENMKFLRESIAQLKANKGSVHELKDID